MNNEVIVPGAHFRTLWITLFMVLRFAVVGEYAGEPFKGSHRTLR